MDVAKNAPGLVNGLAWNLVVTSTDKQSYVLPESKHPFFRQTRCLMNAEAARESLIVGTYLERTPRCARRHEEALDLLPSGIVHDSRRTWPHPLYVDRAAGSRK